MFCTQCGANTANMSKFCTKCGTPLSQNAQPAQGTQQTAQSAAPFGQDPSPFSQQQQPFVQQPQFAQQQPQFGQQPPQFGQQQPFAQQQQPPQFGQQQPFAQQQQPPQFGQQPYGQQPYQQGYDPYAGATQNTQVPYQQPAKIKAKPKWKFILPSIAAACVVATVGIIALKPNKAKEESPAQKEVNKAVSSMKNEVGDRFDGSPAGAVAALAGSLGEGASVTVDFDYTDYWGDTTSGSFELKADLNKRDLALFADLSSYYFDFDIEAYLNKDRFAIGSSLLGGDLYGIDFKTFAKDIQEFADFAGIDSATVDQLVEAVDMISESMNTKESQALGGQYEEIFSDFIKGLNPASERDELRVGGDTINCTKTVYSISKRDIIDLITAYRTELNKDTTLKELLNSSMSSGMMGYGYYGSSTFDALIETMDQLIYAIDTYFEGAITVSMYSNSGDRLMRVECEINMEFEGEEASIVGYLDMGVDKFDPWTLSVVVTDPYGYESAFDVNWTYSESGGKHVNIITMTADDGYYAESTVFGSEWSSSSGDFTLWIESDYEYFEICGNYRPITDGFVLSFDNLMDPYYDESLAISITVKTENVNISSPSFIKPDEWGYDFMEAIEQMMYAMY